MKKENAILKLLTEAYCLIDITMLTGTRSTYFIYLMLAF